MLYATALSNMQNTYCEDKKEHLFSSAPFHTGCVSSILNRRFTRRGNRFPRSEKSDGHHGRLARSFMCSMAILRISWGEKGFTTYESAPSSIALFISGL
jgi:hypothetical protein